MWILAWFCFFSCLAALQVFLEHFVSPPCCAMLFHFVLCMRDFKRCTWASVGGCILNVFRQYLYLKIMIILIENGYYQHPNGLPNALCSFCKYWRACFPWWLGCSVGKLILKFARGTTLMYFMPPLITRKESKFIVLMRGKANTTALFLVLELVLLRMLALISSKWYFHTVNTSIWWLYHFPLFGQVGVDVPTSESKCNYLSHVYILRRQKFFTFSQSEKPHLPGLLLESLILIPEFGWMLKKANLIFHFCRVMHFINDFLHLPWQGLLLMTTWWKLRLFTAVLAVCMFLHYTVLFSST